MGFLNKIFHKKEEEPQKEEIVKIESKQNEVKKEESEAKTQKAVKADKEDTKNAYKILIKPIISEKATEIGKLNQYVFSVNIKANKIEIKKAIMAVYGIKPIRVNVLKIEGKNVRSGRNFGKRKDWKKAIVTLPKGQAIKLHE